MFYLELVLPTKPFVRDMSFPTDEHEAFYEFLLISPSYQLAHKQHTSGLTKDEKKALPKDFKQVLALYDVCGDVYSTTCTEWWESGGRELFTDTAAKLQQLYLVDLTQDTTKLVADFKDYIRQCKAEITQVPNRQIKILTNKIRIGTLHKNAAMIYDKARLQWKSGKRVENWRLALIVGLKSRWAKDLTPDSKKTIENVSARTYLGILVSKHLRDALVVAENAARGRFPCLDPIDTPFDFDYKFIWDVSWKSSSRNMKLRFERERQGIKVKKTYYERKVKPKLRKLKELEELIEIRARQLERVRSKGHS